MVGIKEKRVIVIWRIMWDEMREYRREWLIWVRDVGRSGVDKKVSCGMKVYDGWEILWSNCGRRKKVLVFMCMWCG